jgi:two-component system chemotaxis sensor kinase CheA
MSQVRRLEEIKTSSIEKTQDREVIQYRGSILPLINLYESIDVDYDNSTSDIQNLIIIEFKGKEVALKVNNIVDCIDFEGDLNTHMIDDPCIIGSMVHCGKPYLLVDSYRVFEMALKNNDETTPSVMKSKVLYVDDSSFFLKVVGRYLTEEGYDCVTEIYSPKGLDLLQKERYDLLIVDLEMPEMDGFEFIERVKEDVSLMGLPIIVLSSVISDKDSSRAIELGADECLVKLSREDLVGKVKRYLVNACTQS